MTLSFQQLHAVNKQRCSRWHPGFPGPDEEWSSADWSNAMCGEAGEAANMVKKLRRLETGMRGRASEENVVALVEKLGFEIADVIIYADLLATKFGIDPAAAIITKFNRTSEEYDFPERLVHE